jgi:glutamate N-acetyltransferase/amino-acid N-acetyltransferase
MSTNDTVALMASGASGVAADVQEFQRLLTEVCQDLALQLLSDAEGSSHDIAIAVTGADTEADAVEVGRSVARNNLFKAAIYGNDPNWGRILAAVGTTSAKFDPYNIDVTINGVSVSRLGQPDQPRELVDLTPRKVEIGINLNTGSAAATIYTNDLTHKYVTENSEYSS